MSLDVPYSGHRELIERLDSGEFELRRRRSQLDSRGERVRSGKVDSSSQAPKVLAISVSAA